MPPRQDSSPVLRLKSSGEKSHFVCSWCGDLMVSPPGFEAVGESAPTNTSSALTNGALADGALTNGTLTNGTRTNGTRTNGALTNGTLTNGDLADGTIGAMSSRLPTPALGGACTKNYGICPSCLTPALSRLGARVTRPNSARRVRRAGRIAAVPPT